MDNQSPATLNTERLPVATHNQQPVITTNLMAKMYGTEPANIQKNFNANQERFIAGKHYYKIEGQELAKFRDRFNEICSSGKGFIDDLCLTESHAQIENVELKISSKTRFLLLWTERGSARHAKILNTDQAWEVFDLLEDFYFNRRDPARRHFPWTHSPRTS